MSSYITEAQIFKTILVVSRGKKVNRTNVHQERAVIVACVPLDKGYSFVIRENYNHFHLFYLLFKTKKE